MSNAKNPAAPAFPPEPPELAAERDRLLPELEKQAKAATGTAQAVLRKLHELMAHTRPGAPFDIQIYGDVKSAFERFMKDPVLPPPAIIMQCVEFMQKRLVAFGFTGQMQLPPGAPPVPAGLVETQVSAPAAAPAPMAAPAPAGGGIKDGFEGSAKRSLQINPEAAPPPPANAPEKSEQQKLESFKTWMKNPNVGNVKG
ncbi:hypothetical protein SAMN05444354_101780 [Stigmatella aurantiaca]|uniref:Uncharacterized protein n=1 Tax=Stigmatella aurantiaca TaxID=41 RepID=A0A1H7HR94_STIAU|nr:hypothetical protein [Stigmatella aurantiaca]SEK52207.1 hypothetical protein SAMN05444354_101780 [Stigmatella aurantiaca]